MTDRLVRFLLARVDEDERRLRAIVKAGLASPVDAVSVKRGLAECAAKRAVIGIVQRLVVLRDLPSERPVRDAGVEILKQMARVYSDHQAYPGE